MTTMPLPSRRQAPPGGPRLLVVEDDPTITESLIECRERADVPDPTGPESILDFDSGAIVLHA